MKLKRIIKEEIDDSLDWIKDTPEVTIGGKNGLPIESVPLGTKIVAPNGHVFTMEDVTGFICHINLCGVVIWKALG